MLLLLLLLLLKSAAFMSEEQRGEHKGGIERGKEDMGSHLIATKCPTLTKRFALLPNSHTRQSITAFMATRFQGCMPRITISNHYTTLVLISPHCVAAATFPSGPFQ